MCDLKALSGACGNKIPGTPDYFYLIPQSEIATFPAVKTTTAAGDKKTLAAAFGLSTVVGKGYWRKIPILTGTGNFRSTTEGEVGGKMTKQRFDAFVRGFDNVEAEWNDALVCNDGCMVALIPYKANPNLLIVMGDLNNGVYVESSEGGTGGERVGKQITLYADTGYEPLYYEVSLGVDVTPS
jgi:hypothetical protein